MTARDDIKNMFKTGDIPLGENFASFVDFAGDMIKLHDGNTHLTDKGLKVQIFSYEAESWDAEEGITEALTGYEKVLMVIPMAHSHGWPQSSFYFYAQTMAISDTSFTVRMHEQNSGSSWTNEVKMKVLVIGY